jgi:hypothetical protein
MQTNMGKMSEAYFPDGRVLLITDEGDMMVDRWVHCDGCDKPTPKSKLHMHINDKELLWWLCPTCNTSK